MHAKPLYDAIAEVSPIIACSVGKAGERSTWKWEPGPGATQAQIDAGNNVIATIPVGASLPPPQVDANTRIDAGILAALGTAVSARDAIHAIPASFSNNNFVALLVQMKVISDAFVNMLQAQTKIGGPGNGKPP